MTSDEQLILELKQGSEPAFTELFLRYRERVWAFFRRRMNDAAQAEELAQETFLAVLRGAQRYEPRATFRAYLFGIAFNILAAHRRKSVNDQKSMWMSHPTKWQPSQEQTTNMRFACDKRWNGWKAANERS